MDFKGIEIELHKEVMIVVDQVSSSFQTYTLGEEMTCDTMICNLLAANPVKCRTLHYRGLFGRTGLFPKSGWLNIILSSRVLGQIE